MAAPDGVIVVGAGPVGYAAALNLVRYNIPVTLLEAGDTINDDPRAGTIHPPTLEYFAKLGLTDKFIERGYVVPNYHYRDRKLGLIADFDLGVLSPDTPFPFRLMLEQHKLAGIMHDVLADEANFELLRRHRVETVAQDGDGVTVTTSSDSGEKTFRARYVIGCDGGRSQVRKSMSVDFSGFTFPERFLIISTPYDFAPFGYALTNYIADPEQWCALFKVPGRDETGVWRVVFPIKEHQTEAEIFDPDAIEALVQGFHPKDGRYETVHLNLYNVHQRVASCYREGRVLLAGDAAHINNPLGGMGMNFGFHDVFNLAEKLNRIWHDGASEDLLNQYDRQRRTVATEYLQRQSIENKKNIEQRDPEVRARFLDELRSIAADKEKMRAYLRRVAMIEGLERERAIS